MRNRKRIISISSLAFLSAMILTVTLTQNRGNSFMNALHGESTSYLLQCNSSNAVTESDVSAGVKVVNTTSGNQVPFALHNAVVDPDGGFVRLANTGDYIEVASPSLVKGITKIAFEIKGRYSMAVGLFAGANNGDLTVEKRFCKNGDNWLTVTDEYVFENPVNYFRFENVDKNYVRFNYFKVTYSCEEAEEKDVLESYSHDMLGKATAGDSKSIFGSDIYTVDFKNADVSAASSGYALKITGNENADGWPTALLNLNSSFDFTNKGLSLNVKFVDLYKWISITLYGSDWQEITKFEADITGTGWRNYVFPHSKLVAGLAQYSKTESDLADVCLMKLCLNFDTYKGITQSVIIDEIHPSEETSIDSTQVLRLEHYTSLDDGERKNNTVSTDYTDFCGTNSVSSRKVTFENITKDYGMTNTLVFETSKEGIDFTNGVLEFDLKASNNLMFGSGANKHQMSLKILSDWGDGKKSGWFNIHDKGASGYTNGYTTNGWFHVTINTLTEFGALGASSIRVYLAIGGVSATNKADVWVKYDNITFTKAA